MFFGSKIFLEFFFYKKRRVKNIYLKKIKKRLFYENLFFFLRVDGSLKI